MNRISLPDWVKFCVDPNGRIKLCAKQKCKFLCYIFNKNKTLREDLVYFVFSFNHTLIYSTGVRSVQPEKYELFQFHLLRTFHPHQRSKSNTSQHDNGSDTSIRGENKREPSRLTQHGDRLKFRLHNDSFHSSKDRPQLRPGNATVVTARHNEKKNSTLEMTSISSSLP